MAEQSAAALIGRRVVTQDDVRVGEVTDVIYDDNLTVRGYLIKVGGFLGIDASSVFLPTSRAIVRVDGVLVELVLDILAAEIQEIAHDD